jgi:hypothetical protein
MDERPTELKLGKPSDGKHASDSEELRHDIEETREHLDHVVGELAERVADVKLRMSPRIIWRDHKAAVLISGATVLLVSALSFGIFRLITHGLFGRRPTRLERWARALS